MLAEIRKACLSFGTNYYTLSQVTLHTLIARDLVLHRLGKLERAGLITRVKCWETPLPGFSKGRPTKESCYRNTKLLKQKVETDPPRKPNSWDKMWKTIRVLRRFTHSDLVIICQQDIENVRYFVKRYRQLGYIRQFGKRGKEKTWTLTKSVGPQRPLKEVANVVA